MTPTPNSTMLVLAREARGMSQTELAKVTGIPQARISRMEQGLIPIPIEDIGAVAAATSFPTRFFFEPGHIYPAAVNFHRARASLGKKVQYTFEAWHNIVHINLKVLLKAAEPPQEDVPYFVLDVMETPEACARSVRQQWRIPRGPVGSMVDALENAGILVVDWDFGTRQIDGLSYLVPNLPPVIFVNKDLAGDRLRFTLAHELGHIVMHRSAGPDIENQADRFASEFLMPADEIGPQLTGLRLDKAASLKLYWKVSMHALIYKAEKMRRITKNQARYLYMQLGRAGHRLSEPPHLDIPREKPTVLPDMIRMHRRELGYSEVDLASLLLLPPEDFRRIYELAEEERHLSVVK